MPLGKTNQLLDKVSHVVGRMANLITCAAIAAMALFISLNVILRYVFNIPLKGSVEFPELMMVVAAFAAFGYTALLKGHVNIEILTLRLPQRARTILEDITTLISLIILAFVAWQGVVIGNSLRLSALTAGVTGVPVYPFYYVLSFGCILMCLVLIVELLHSLGYAIKRSPKELLLWLLFGGAVAASPWWIPQIPVEINPLIVGGISILFLFIVLFSGMPIGIGLALLGFVGVLYLVGTNAGLGVLKSVPYRTASQYMMTVVPLYVLMGEIAFAGGLSRDLYFAARQWLAKLRGGLAMATVTGCAGFAAICGSSVATAVAMGTVSLPEMERYGYDPKLSTGSIAAGGTLGILIPPSLGFIIYGLMTEQSIGKLFFAGVFPGILLASLFIITIYITTRRNPQLAPPGPASSLKEKITAIRGIWAVLILFALVMGGIYLGVFTPSEAGGVGAIGALVIAAGLRRLTWQKLGSALVNTARVTGMVFLIIIGAMIFGYFLAYTKLPFELAAIVSNLPLPPIAILIVVLIVYLILGCLMDTMAMIILTIPIFYPLITALGFDPIWFGVLLVITMEAGMITPPIGVNVYVIKGVAKGVPLETVFIGIFPFLIAMIVCLAILIAFPQISLFLPNLIK